MRKFNIPGLLLVMMPIAFLTWNYLSPGAPGKKTPSIKKSPPQIDVLKVQSDLVWQDLSEDQLTTFVSFFEKSDANQIVTGSIEALVTEGETVVTEGYEIEPGEFVFSTLTPRLETLPDGSTCVRIAATTMRIGISGAYETLSADTFYVSPKNGLTCFILHHEKMLSLDISARKDETSALIRIKASGEAVHWKQKQG